MKPVIALLLLVMIGYSLVIYKNELFRNENLENRIRIERQEHDRLIQEKKELLRQKAEADSIIRVETEIVTKLKQQLQNGN